MGDYKILKEKVPDFIKALDKFEVFAPVKKGDTVRFEKIDDPSRATLDFSNTNVPPKELMFPETETLFRYRVVSTEIEPKVPSDEEKRVVLGIRPCDAMAFSIVDRLFGWDFPDPYYQKRRENSILVGLACAEPCSNCFCTSLGGGPANEEPLDAILYDLGEFYYLKTITDKSEAFVSSAGDALESAGDSERAQATELAGSAEKKIKRTIKTEGIPEKLPSLYDHEFWTQYSNRCLGCGICTFLCPTCHCFDIQDEIEAFDGRRARMWDTCMFAEYTLHASGHNPRPTRKERTRNRISHKYSYFPTKFGVIACVGCGRCINFCPVNIDIIDVLQKSKEV